MERIRKGTRIIRIIGVRKKGEKKQGGVLEIKKDGGGEKKDGEENKKEEMKASDKPKVMVKTRRIYVIKMKPIFLDLLWIHFYYLNPSFLHCHLVFIVTLQCLFHFYSLCHPSSPHHHIFYLQHHHIPSSPLLFLSPSSFFPS
jgi:hypothetical protein